MLKLAKHILVLFIIVYSNAAFSKPPIFVNIPEDAIVLSEDIKVNLLFIFSAEWCVACDKLKNDIHNDLSVVDDHIVCYIDIEQRKDLATEFKVKRIPECIIYRNKIERKRRVGYKNKEEFKKWLLLEK